MKKPRLWKVILASVFGLMIVNTAFEAFLEFISSRNGGLINGIPDYQYFPYNRITFTILTIVLAVRYWKKHKPLKVKETSEARKTVKTADVINNVKNGNTFSVLKSKTLLNVVLVAMLVVVLFAIYFIATIDNRIKDEVNRIDRSNNE